MYIYIYIYSLPGPDAARGGRGRATRFPLRAFPLRETAL